MALKGLRWPNGADVASIAIYAAAAVWLAHYGVPIWVRIAVFMLVVVAGQIAREGNAR